jgi:hypothetical protein
MKQRDQDWDERVKLPLDPKVALSALLKVKTDHREAEDSEKSPGAPRSGD